MVSYMETALRGLDYGLGPNKRCTQNRSRVCHRSPIVMSMRREGQGPTIAASFSVCSEQVWLCL